MKKIILVALLLSLFSSLHAYSKKIIFSAFSNMENAQRSLQGFKETNSYKEIESLAKANNFIVHARISGRYYIVVAEPFYSKDVAKKAFRLGKKEYRNAYMNTYEAPTKPEERVVVKTSTEELKSIEKHVEVEKKEKVEQEKNTTVVQIKSSQELELKEKELNEIQEIDKNETKETIEEFNDSQEMEKTEELDTNLSEIKKTIAEQNKTKISVERTKEFAFSVLDTLLYLFLATIFGVAIFYFVKFKRVYDEY